MTSRLEVVLLQYGRSPRNSGWSWCVACRTEHTVKNTKKKRIIVIFYLAPRDVDPIGANILTLIIFV